MDSNSISRYGTRPFAITLMGVLALEFFAIAIPVSLAVTFPLVITGILRVLQAAFILWAAVRFHGEVSIPGLSLATMAKGIKRGLLWSAIFGLLAAGTGITLILAGQDPIGMVRISLPGESLFIVFLVAALVGPITEELFFRGAIYGFLRRFGVVAAVLASSSMFVLAHSYAGIALTHMIGALVFAIAYEYEKNIMVPITIHVLGNFTLFFIAVL